MKGTEERLKFEDPESFKTLCGAEESNLKAVEEAFGVRISTRGTSAHVQGSQELVSLVSRGLRELYGSGLPEELFSIRRQSSSP